MTETRHSDKETACQRPLGPGGGANYSKRRSQRPGGGEASRGRGYAPEGVPRELKSVLVGSLLSHQSEVKLNLLILQSQLVVFVYFLILVMVM